MIARPPIQLIVNADDFGYFPCISRGIVNAAQTGALTATGILANSPNLSEQLKYLDGLIDVDLGVHLNLSHLQPLTRGMIDNLAAYGGSFPSVYKMTRLILTGKVSIETVRTEWRAQIEICQYKKLYFLNSHEHIHMLPSLFGLAGQLAKDYEIPFVRVTRPDWITMPGVSGLMRNILIQTMGSLNQYRHKAPMPLFLGLGSSGKLNFAYLERLFATLQPGNSYELMCHPGFFAANEIADSKLIAYHDWEGELALLQSEKIHSLYAKLGIHLSHYHALTH